MKTLLFLLFLQGNIPVALSEVPGFVFFSVVLLLLFLLLIFSWTRKANNTSEEIAEKKTLADVPLGSLCTLLLIDDKPFDVLICTDKDAKSHQLVSCVVVDPKENKDYLKGYIYDFLGREPVRNIRSFVGPHFSPIYANDSLILPPDNY